MRFHGRHVELAVLEKARAASEQGPACMTVITGRKRVGKTTLVRQSVAGRPILYLFVAQTSDVQLCRNFAAAARTVLGVFIPYGITRFADLFEVLMVWAKDHPFTLVIDEFQNFLEIDSSVYSQMQDIWDRMKDESRIHLVLCGSSRTQMQRIFEEPGKPLYGMATDKLEVSPFTPSELKEVLAAASAEYTNDDLLALYTLTGGVPFYVADLIDSGAVTKEKMLDRMLSAGCVYLAEGRDLLSLELGEASVTYRAVLSAVAHGVTGFSGIAEHAGETNISPYLDRMESAGIIGRVRPVLADSGTRNSRWEVRDQFLRFWVRYIMPDEGRLDAGMPEQTKARIIAEWQVFSGTMLNRWFREKLAETCMYREVGSWWSGRAGRNEVGIVAVGNDGKTAFAADVCLNGKSFHEMAFIDKVEHLKTGVLYGYEVESGCLTLEDM